MVCGIMGSIARRVNPPMATFLFTLVLCATGLIAYAFYITSHTLADPNIQDWNSFLTNFDNIEFCVDTNSVMKSSDVMKNISVTTTGITTGEGDEDLLASIRQSYLSKSVCLKVDTNVRPSKAVDQDTTLLRGVHHVLFKLAANSFGIQGELSRSPVFGYLELPEFSKRECIVVNSSTSLQNSSEQCSTSGGSQFSASGHTRLVLMTNETDILPRYKQRPELCFQDDKNGQKKTSKLISEALDQILNVKEESTNGKTNMLFVPKRRSNSTCGKSPHSLWTTTKRPVTVDSDPSSGGGMGLEFYVVDIYHKFDIDLTAFLSMGDQSLINMHLVHTSYFLLLIVALLIVFSLVRCRQNSQSSSSSSSSALPKDLPSDKSASNSRTINGLKQSGKNAFVLLQNEGDDDSDLEA
ncbi:transmembrane protein 248-like [Convolutriloba macropyga]|uniref:transmembrane protein 248-like n=1 Tax=Convolutriloba macropyga TaxID=536237 RepID=UPI003F51C937